MPVCKHENKVCPRCHAGFECKVGDITKCQCYTVKLNDAERDFLARTYNDCLCADCIKTVRTDWNQAQKEMQLKRFFGLNRGVGYSYKRLASAVCAIEHGPIYLVPTTSLRLIMLPLQK